MTILHETHFPVTRAEVPWALLHGAIGGIVAGIIFAMFEMIVTASMMGPDAFFMPLRMIGAIALGKAALEPAYSLWSAGLAGVVVHMVLSNLAGSRTSTLMGAV